MEGSCEYVESTVVDSQQGLDILAGGFYEMTQRMSDLDGPCATGQRKLRNGDLLHLYFSSYIIGMIISRTMRWVGRVACRRDEKCV
jgi:hypothetical protein